MELEDVENFLKDNWIWLVVALVITSVIIGVIFLRKKIKGRRCSSKARLDGKTAIVTGSNIGMGKETARDFYKRGARVILACRNMERATEAARDIQTTPNTNSNGTVVIRQLDLTDLSSVRKFATDILTTESRIDILVNNAGVVVGKSITEDGYDMTFQTNHLGPFLLTNLLLDRIKASAPSRIVNVSSAAYQFSRMYWDDLNLNEEGAYGSWKAYGQTKLANILFTKELAQRLQGTGVTTYTLHPGAVLSGVNRYDSNLVPTIFHCFVYLAEACLMKTSEQGAQTQIHCAVCEKAAHQTGLYYDECRPSKPKRHARDDASAKMLWNVSAEMVKLEDKLKTESSNL